MLTPALVERADIRPAEYEVSDGVVPGLSLRVSPNGRKTFRLTYSFRGKRRQTTLGHTLEMDLEDARAEASETLKLVRQGRDPKIQKDAVTVARFVHHRFVPGYVDRRLKPATARAMLGRLDRHVVPALGAHGVRDVMREDVSALHHSLRDTPYEANRVLSLCSAIFRYAAECGMRDALSNPAKGIRPFKERARVRRLTDEELDRLGAAIQACPLHEVTYCLLLLVLTGCRKNEIAGLTWAEVAEDLATLHLRDSKTGPRDVPLVEEAQALLRACAARRRESTGNRPLEGHVFPLLAPPSQALDYRFRQIREEAGLPDVRIHDLRRLVATRAATNGAPLASIAAALGHSSQRTTERYVQPAAEDARAALSTGTAGLLGRLRITEEETP